MILPVRARLFYSALLLAALACVVWAVASWRGPLPTAYVLMGVLVALAIVAQHFPVQLAPGHKVDLSLAVYFACLPLFGTATGVILVGLAQLAGGATLALRRNPDTGKRLRSARNVLFNASQLVVATVCAGLVLTRCFSRRPPVPLDEVADLWILPTTAVALYLVNSAAVAAMVGLQRGESPLSTWWAGQRKRGPQYAVLFFLGLIIALLGMYSPWAPLLVAIPSALVHLSFKRTGEMLAERQMIAAQRAHEATHDPLTGLANRGLFHERASEALRRTGRRSDAVALLFVDLDNFKVINDSLGHAAGDRVLVAVAARLQAAVCAGDLVARFGGDEFTVLLEDLPDGQEASTAARRLAASMHAPVVVEGHELLVSMSIGIAVAAATTTLGDLLRDADTALYRAKAAGKAQYVAFGPSMSAHAAHRLTLEIALRRALERGEFVLHYQPKVTPTTGAIVGVEGLVRWAHPERGIVPPGEFIPVLEETGMILPLGAWVIEEAARQGRVWQARYPGHPPLSICVNLSARQFRHPDLFAQVAQTLRDSGLAPGSFALELTESLLMETGAATLATLHELKGLGIQLAIDDFGTGYSSLRYLQHFPVHALKIDRSFVADVGSDRHVDGIVRAIVALAHTLELEVVAEGVETAAQLAQVRALGCDLVQGYYFARPQSAAALTTLLDRGFVLDDGRRQAMGNVA